MRPNRSTAACTAASASALLVTSSLTGSKSADWARLLDTRSRSLPVATTESPAARRLWRNRRPSHGPLRLLAKPSCWTSYLLLFVSVDGELAHSCSASYEVKVVGSATNPLPNHG